MSEMEMKTEAETEEFADELSDEALDRAEGAFSLDGRCHGASGGCYFPSGS